ncbi:MAG: phosphoribose diphosphate--decaprenyl-phosphate phosphoribosyltransferase, partial [Bacteroidota bacterium]
WVPVDILLIAIGFQLRIFAGGEIADAPISKWLVLMIFLGALMLSMVKLRSDFQTYLQLGKKLPKRLQPYDPAFSSYAIVFLAGIATVAYIMYTISEEVLARIGHEEIYFSNLFMIMGMMRYLQLSLLDGKGGKPSELFVRDPFLIVMVLGWIMTFGVLLYLV